MRCVAVCGDGYRLKLGTTNLFADGFRLKLGTTNLFANGFRLKLGTTNLFCRRVPAEADATNELQFAFYLISLFFKQKTAYEILSGLVGSEMCIRDSVCS